MSPREARRRYTCKTCGAAAPAGIGYVTEEAGDLPQPAPTCQNPHAREYDDRNECIQCGEHIADPHAPNCPAVA